MTHTNRARIRVDISGDWQAYTPTIPDGATVMGTVTVGHGITGALIRWEKDGTYSQVIEGSVRRLDGRKIAAAMGTSGRPTSVPDGRRVNIFLDPDSIATAKVIGDGKIGEGIRRALAKAKGDT
ncbi:MAG: hypothetical protein HQL73_02695 [Magnetococcales bacterium]|nr:hypothetical protein [Magnetococcales bacterium]